MHTKIALARELVSCLGGLDLRIVSDQDDSVGALIRESFYSAVFPHITDRNILMYLARMEPGCVYFFSSILDLSYIGIRVGSKQEYLIAGPCRQRELSESRIRSSLRSHDLTSTTMQQIVSYCRWQPVLSPEKFYQLGILLGRYVLDLPEPIPHQRIEYNWTRSHYQFTEPDPYTDHSRIRQIEMRYEASTALTEAVKAGNLSLALRMIQGIRTDTGFLDRNPDPLRNLQNMCIVMNTQLRHAMEERNIHPYRLDSVSTEIARQIEALKTLDEVRQFFARIIRRYCELSQEKNYSHLAPLSRQAVVYIKNHLTDNLTVKETAKALLVNANYLSGKFRQEVGMTFTDFVNQQRTEQAAALLRHTNLQIQQIAATVGYNNASHFAKQFFRFYGQTPRDYRSQSTPQPGGPYSSQQ